MGILRRIMLDIHAPFNEQTIKNILHKAEKAGCILYTLEEGRYASRRYSLDEAIACVMKNFKTPDENNVISVHKNKADFTFSFSFVDEKTIVFSTCVTPYYWEKDFSEDYGIHKDYARYIRLLLHITQDFPLLAINLRYD